MSGRDRIETPQWLWVRLKNGAVVRRVLLEEEPGRYRLVPTLPGQQEMFTGGQGVFSWKNGSDAQEPKGEETADPFHDTRKPTREDV